MQKCCLKIFITSYIIICQARRACQRQRSILLEFDTRGEVEDFQRLVRTVLSENLHILSEIVTFCQYLSLFLSHVVFIVSSGEGWAPWFETWPTGLAWSLLPAGFFFSCSFFGSSLLLPSAAGISLPIQPDGRWLDVKPLTKCDASRGRRLCQSWVSIIYIHNRSGMVGCCLW